MGQIQSITNEQKIILDEIKNSNFLRSNFYYTGGTALSSVYLHHRYSNDLDFFSQNKFENQAIFTIMEEFSRKHDFTFQSRFVEVVYIFNLKFKNKTNLKVDFSYYPYPRLEKSLHVDNLEVDSIFDISVNKLLTVSQRTNVKDFVDLFYLLEKFTIWDLIEGVRVKFKMEIEPFLLASDFLKVEDFDFLPKMIKPLSLKDLKLFFRSNAKKINN